MYPKVSQVKKIHVTSQDFIHQTIMFHAVGREFLLEVKLDYSKINLLPKNVLPRELPYWISSEKEGVMISCFPLLDDLKAGGFIFMGITWTQLEVQQGCLRRGTWGCITNCKEPAPGVLRSGFWAWLISSLAECYWGKSPYLSECQFS